MKDSIDTNGIVIGRNTVREALKSERSVDAVYVASGAQDGSIRELLALAKKNRSSCQAGAEEQAG